VRYIKDPKEAAQLLVESVIGAKPEGDNVTVVVIRLRDPPTHKTPKIHRSHLQSTAASARKVLHCPGGVSYDVS
jgi:hypothetical protein